MFKAVDKWLPGYLQSLLSRPRPASGTRHLIIGLCDHYEPFRDGADVATARQTVNDWLAAYPASVDGFRDADGRPPRHTFFYPQEEYDEAILDRLAAFCRQGHGEVEIHLHHRHDTPEGLRGKLVTFRDLLHNQHGLLGETLARSEVYEPVEKLVAVADKRWPHMSRPTLSKIHALAGAATERNPYGLKSNVSSSPVRYAFIHGNWSLCNSRPDGDWCGVNEELGILAETGCYADFTFPSAPSPTQPRMVNAIYYASDTPGRPRGADKGTRAKTREQENTASREDAKNANDEGIVCAKESKKNVSSLSRSSRLRVSPSLLIITGPLALNWRRRKWGLLPRFENADLGGSNPPTAERIRLWADQRIGVAGRPDWVFVKLHTHGCMPQNARVLFGEAMRRMHEVLQAEYNDGKSWQLHYVTAREMFNLVKAAEANLPGPPGQYRDTPILWKA